METITGMITITDMSLKESGLAPVTVMITITKLELNLKCNYNCTCDLPQICTKLEIETY